MIAWTDIRSLTSSRTVSVTSVWIFVVPLVVKFVHAIDFFTFEDVGIDSMPESFLLLYLSAVSFFLGSLAYYLFCPSLVKNYSNFADFKSSGGGMYYLGKYFSDLRAAEVGELKELLLDNIEVVLPADVDENLVDYIYLGKDGMVLNFRKTCRRRVFEVMFLYLDKRYHKLALVAFTFYLLGFLILFYLFVHNFVLVLSSI